MYMKILKYDNSFKLKIYEAKTKLLTAFENKFGKDFVYSPKMNFKFDSKSFSQVYSLLNAYLFENKLKLKRLKVFNCSDIDLNITINKMNIKTTNDLKDLYAAYVPEVNKKTNKLVSESIFLMTDKGKMTFLFAVGELCHEMIHQYDANYGNFIRLIKEDEQLGIDRSHETPIFVRFMKLAALEGIRVMINGNNTPFDILNQEAIQFTLNLQEDDNTHFQDLVKRLEAGEKVPNVCLTNRGTVAYFIP